MRITTGQLREIIKESLLLEAEDFSSKLKKIRALLDKDDFEAAAKMYADMNKDPSYIGGEIEALIFDYDETRSKSYNYVELGYFCLKKKLIFNLIDDKNVSFSKIILKLIKLKKLNYFKTNSIYLSITNNNNLLRTNKLIKKYFQFFHK